MAAALGNLLPELSKPFKAGDLSLKNRVVLAPLTRARSGASRVPNDSNVLYYKQRANAGLVITEATTVSEMANGWADSPGIYTDEMEAGWKKVCEAVHGEGGTIVCQLWYIGRAGHSSFMPEGMNIVSASAIPIEGEGAWAADFTKQPHETPTALTVEQLEVVVEEYGAAAKRAKNAGFDGIEIHAGNGYLIDQFLQTKTNKRDDKYGGSDEGRFLLLKEVLERCLKEFPASRVGVRISPNGAFNDMGSENNFEYFKWVAAQLDTYNLAYLSVMDGLAFGYHEKCPQLTCEELRKVYKNPIFGNCGYDGEMANERIGAGHADAVIFGRPFIANPDLPARLTNGWPLVESDASLWYSASEATRANPDKGYTDYPYYSA